VSGSHSFFTFATEHASILLGCCHRGAIAGVMPTCRQAVVLRSMIVVLRNPQREGAFGEDLRADEADELLRLHVTQKETEKSAGRSRAPSRSLSAAMTAMPRKPRLSVDRAGTGTNAPAGRGQPSAASRRSWDFRNGIPDQWRMLLAADRLMNSHDSVSAIALSLGYESESASAAFRGDGLFSRQYARRAAALAVLFPRGLRETSSSSSTVGTQSLQTVPISWFELKSGQRCADKPLR